MVSSRVLGDIEDGACLSLSLASSLTSWFWKEFVLAEIFISVVVDSLASPVLCGYTGLLVWGSDDSAKEMSHRQNNCR